MDGESKTTNSTEVYIKRNRIVTAVAGAVCFAAAIVLYAVFYFKICPKISADGLLLLGAIGIALWSMIMFVVGVLCFRNLLYPNVVKADADGLEVHSGFLHIGHVDWNEVEKITLGSGNKWYDIIDGELFSPIRLGLKDEKQFKSERDLAKRYVYFWNGDGVKLRTYCTTKKKRKMTEQLTELLERYSAPIGRVAEENI